MSGLVLTFVGGVPTALFGGSVSDAERGVLLVEGRGAAGDLVDPQYVVGMAQVAGGVVVGAERRPRGIREPRGRVERRVGSELAGVVVGVEHHRVAVVPQ